MHIPYYAPSSLLVPTSSSPKSSVDGALQSNSFNIPTQLPTPSTQHQTGNHIPIDSEYQYHMVQAQPSAPEQAVPSRPLVSVCDRASLQDVLDSVRSLNSSISDAVNAIMEETLKSLVFVRRKNFKYFSRLAQVAVEECARVKNDDLEMRKRFLNALLHDMIINFVYDCVEGSRMGKINEEYMKFRMDITKVRRAVPFVDAQNWVRIAAKLVPDTPQELWEELAKKLAGACNAQFRKISEIKNGNKPRSMIIVKMAPQHFSAILKSAYEISMDIQSRILSQRLGLIVGRKDSKVDPNSVQFGEEFTQALPVEKESGYRDPFILGYRSFGVTGELDDGTRRIILKPIVDFYHPT